MLNFQLAERSIRALESYLEELKFDELVYQKTVKEREIGFHP